MKTPLKALTLSVVLFTIGCGQGKSLKTVGPDLNAGNGIGSTTSDLTSDGSGQPNYPVPPVNGNVQCALTPTTKAVEVFVDASGNILPGQQAPIIPVGLVASRSLENKSFSVQEVTFDPNRLKSEFDFTSLVQSSAIAQFRPLTIGVHTLSVKVYLEGNSSQAAQCSTTIELKGKIAPQTGVVISANGVVGNLVLANGQSLTLSHNAVNTSSCSLFKNGASISGSLGPVGSLSLGYQANAGTEPLNSAYEVRCQGPTASISSVVYVTLNPAASVTLTATKQSGITNLVWSSKYTLPTCVLAEGLNISTVGNAGSLSIPTPTTNKTMVLACNDYANALVQRAVEVGPTVVSPSPSPSPSPAPTGPTRWYQQTQGLVQPCSKFCSNKGLQVRTSPDGAQCASSYIRPPSAEGYVNYFYGTSGPGTNVSGATYNGDFCQLPGQTIANRDNTYKSVACFCGN